jgi:ligand-binding sensor domain-containing protein/class 3 adenylate cyclase/predicted metal-dependent HD superfamily phosphohydrolase
LKKVISLFLVVIAINTCIAQQSSIKFGRLGLKEGLSQSDVLSIQQTNNGLLWFGTQDGLNAYNGFEFKVYSHDLLNPSSISNSYIHAVLEENDSLLWVGTENGLNLFNTGTQKFKNVFHSKKYKKRKVNVWALAKDSVGALWVGTDRALYRIDVETNQIEKIDLQFIDDRVEVNIRKILITSNNNVLLATEGKGLINYDVETGIVRHFNMSNTLLKSDIVWDIHKDSDGRIAIATNKGVNFFDSKRRRISSLKILDDVIESNVVKTIFEDKSGIIWVGTESNGLYRLKSLSNIDHYEYDVNRSTSLNSNKINTIFEDEFGIVWIGSQAGLNKFDEQKQYFKHHQYWKDNKKTINSNMIWSLFKDGSDGSVYVGTDKGLNVFNQKTGNVKVINPSFSFTKKKKNNSIYSIYKDSDEDIYVGTDGGVFSYKNGKLIHINASDDQNTSRTYSIVKDKDKNLWFATKEGLTVLENEGKTFKTYTTLNGLPSDIVRVVFCDKIGNVWIGTDGGGFCKAVVQGDSLVFKTYQNDTEGLNSLSNNTVLSIYQDKEEFLWIGTFGGGLNRFDIKNENFTVFTEKDGLSNNVIYGVLPDNNANLWLSTNKGISFFNTKTNEFKVFDVTDGLQSNEFNNGAFYKCVDGQMFFGGINGFNSFYPKDITINKTKAKPIITQFYLFNKPVKIGPEEILKKEISELDKINLEYKENVISFEFAALHYSYPLKNQHKYMLENFDEDWVYIGNNRRANYTNLDPGEYIFKVMVANSDGVWSDEVAEIHVIVESPFWKTLWFILLVYVLIPLIITLGIIRYRINQVKAQKELLEILVKDRTKEVSKQKELLEVEKNKAEELLLNILPAETAEELKAKGKATARKYRMTSIMFTDFKGFTKIAEVIKPEDLVAELDNYFRKFDEIIEKYDVEKIKTIGDAYMCAGGIPIRNKSNPIDVVLAGLEIQRFMISYNEIKAKKGEKGWGLRIGVHTGAVVAGVIGSKRFAYDIWGDSVNIASRIEAASDVGKVNISGVTYGLVKEFFTCEYRGEIKAKNKGKIDMYYVHGIKPELSIDGKGIVPNELFQKYIDLHIYSSIHYMKAERYIVDRLKNELPKNLYYHDLRHTTDVCAAVERLALMEGIEGDDIFLLKTAALYHDAGFVHQYRNNEDLGAAMAQEVLPRFGYTQEQIEKIGRLIRSTKVPQKPKTHLQQIICDADLDYLGGDEFHEIADNLKRELTERDAVSSDKQWDELQVKFLESHTYFTKTAIKLRRQNKLDRLEEIKERLKTYD